MNSRRSYKRITQSDLRRLARIARADREDFFRRYIRWRPYQRRILCVALCQGAGLHYVDANNGVKDFDVYTFYEARSDLRPFPPRRKSKADFGPSKFGRHPNDTSLIGRRVDLLGRSIARPKGMSWTEAVRHYVKTGKRRSTPWYLAQKAIVVLQPPDHLGEVLWP